MLCLHLHVELLIKDHETLNLKVYTNGCFVISIKQIATVPAKDFTRQNMNTTNTACIQN